MNLCELFGCGIESIRITSKSKILLLSEFACEFRCNSLGAAWTAYKLTENLEFVTLAIRLCILFGLLGCGMDTIRLTSNPRLLLLSEFAYDFRWNSLGAASTAYKLPPSLEYCHSRNSLVHFVWILRVRHGQHTTYL